MNSVQFMDVEIYCFIFMSKRSDLDLTYKADRGAHFYWLKKGTVENRPDHILNLIHYEV